MNLLSALYHTDSYKSRVNRVKAVFIYAVLTIILLLLLVITPIGLNIGIISSPLVPVVAFGLIIIVYALTRQRFIEIASWLILLSFVSILAANDLVDGRVESLSLLFYGAIVVLAGFLVGTRGIVVVVTLIIVQLMLQANIVGLLDDSLMGRIPLAIAYLTIGGFVFAYNQFVLASRREGVAIEEVERFKLAEINMRITRQASERANIDTALNSTLALILENYPSLYHAQVFLLDDDGVQARLAASTGETGRRLIEKGHSLAVGSLSVIGQVTLTGERVIAVSGKQDSVHRANQLLPETQLEAAFPLRVGDSIIGALDLQSKVLEDLSFNDEQTFQSLANSVSLAIDSIRQFEQAKLRIEENQRLAEQTRVALREVERLNQRLIGRAWTEYVQSLGDDMGLEVDFGAESQHTYLDWSSTLAEATQSNNLVQEGNVIAVPLRVRGEAIGAIEFELPASQDISPEDVDLMLEVSERFGLAAENTRLLEESQRTAQRETLINQISSRFQSAQNVETTLTEAARSLTESLEAEKVLIRLGTPDDLPNGKNGKES